MRVLRAVLAWAMLFQIGVMPAFAQSRARLMHGTYAFALSGRNAEAGSVAITAKDADHTIVVVRTNDKAAISADLRVGSCASLGGHTFLPLNPPRDGVSSTTVRVGIVKLAGGSFSVRVKSASGDGFSCANIARANLADARP